MVPMIIHADAVAGLKTLESGSVELIVTSPPYDQLRTYGGRLEWDFASLAVELYRVLCPGGVLCWNVNDSVIDGSETLTSCEQKIFFRRTCGFVIHDTMIYERSNFSQPSSNRYHQVLEYIFVLSKGRPRCFHPIMDKPNAGAGTRTLGVNRARQADGAFRARARTVYAKFGKRGNVWRGKTRGQEEMCQALPHPAMMPKWLARDLIRSWSNAGDTVLDPLAGSGTTGAQAMKLGRQVILIEKRREYVRLCRRAVEH